MTDQRKALKGKLEILIGNAIKLIIDFDDEKEVISALSSIEKIKESLVKYDKVFSTGVPTKTIPIQQGKDRLSEVEDEYGKIANMLDDVNVENLRQSKIFSIKEDAVQLLKPNQFKTATEALCVLIFILESGLGKRDIPYEAFRNIFESQNIKSGSPLVMLMNNLKNAKYIDSKKYDAKTISLTPKGQENAIGVLNKLVTTTAKQ
ncbi:MAG: hypothetical protein C4533_05915 [Candidatus Omnitrophota bacterium]|jgi:hypothetical protein|nr:MAG: hypothetical protein C4533_05915 [Candidatus Omnitrophota bacterium]